MNKGTASILIVLFWASVLVCWFAWFRWESNWSQWYAPWKWAAILLAISSVLLLFRERRLAFFGLGSLVTMVLLKVLTV